MELTDIEIKEFWEKLGHHDFAIVGVVPDLNNLFKYAVPKADVELRMYSSPYSGRTSFITNKGGEKAPPFGLGDKDPAAALFRAIQQVFKGS